MTDNQLYNYFKERQHNFNEMPGDQFWQKLELQLHRESAASKTSLLINVSVILLLAVVVAIGIFIYNSKTITGPIIKPIEEQSTGGVVTGPSSITGKAEYSPNIPQAKDTVKKKRAVLPVESQVLNMKPEAVNLQPEIVNIKPDVLSKCALPGNNKITTPLGKIRIESLDQLTQMEYDTLVARAVKYYSNQPKSILIIVAKGHKPYRKVIQRALEQQNTELQNGSIRFINTADTIKESKPVFVPFKKAEPKKSTEVIPEKNVFKVRSKAQAVEDTADF